MADSGHLGKHLFREVDFPTRTTSGDRMCRIRSLFSIFAWLALSFYALSAPLWAEIHFIAPPKTTDATQADGSRTYPWPSLSEAFASGRIVGGDTVRLLEGSHGLVVLSKIAFDTVVIIEPEDGVKAHLDGLEVRQSKNLHIRNLQVWPSAPGKRPLVTTDSRSPGIIFQGLDIRSRADAETYPNWSKEDWLSFGYSGIRVAGAFNTVSDSTFTGLAFAIAATGPNSKIEGNLVSGFSGDGARVLGDGSIFRGNRIEDCVQIDNNHADGFQSWSRGPKGKAGEGTVRDLIISNNIIREWAHPTLSPLHCSLQGIGMFDGMFEDVIIENNFIQVSAPHGITVAGGVRAKIVHNTVINNRAPHAKFPWIRLPPHKNGTPATDGVIANNIATMLQYDRKSEFRITASGNLTGMAPARIFMDPAKGDFRPRSGGPAEGKGDPDYRLPVDLFGQPRDAAPDIGAIEFR